MGGGWQGILCAEREEQGMSLCWARETKNGTVKNKEEEDVKGKWKYTRYSTSGLLEILGAAFKRNSLLYNRIGHLETLLHLKLTKDSVDYEKKFPNKYLLSTY